MAEATPRSTKFGLVYDGDGWFVLNARETRWRDTGPLGFFSNFEGKRPFRQVGITLNVLQPGQPMGRYHRENAQEGFLVLACPPQTEHIVVGAGGGASVVLAVGRRGLHRKGIVYTVSEAALARGAGVQHETADWGEAYAGLVWNRVRYGEGWLPDFEH